MNMKEIETWKGWAKVALILLTTNVATGVELYADSERYTDSRVGEMREYVCAEFKEIHEDLRTIREDIKKILRVVGSGAVKE